MSLEPEERIDPKIADSVDLIEIADSVKIYLEKRIGKKWKVVDDYKIGNLLASYANNFNDFFKYGKGEKAKTYHLFVDKEDLGPLDSLNLKRLIELAKPSKFGKGHKDIFDENVRKAKEIVGSRISIRSRIGFESYIYMNDVALKSNTKFKLHKLCIYEEGGFFSKHVDSVHKENHYGSVVVCLPTQHEGGELIIRFDSKEKIVNFSENVSEKTCQMVSFYTDCEHEVKPVTKGTRVVLHYDMLCKDDDTESTYSVDLEIPESSDFSRLAANTAIIDKLVRKLEKFDLPYKKDNIPIIPAIFLFHRYSLKGLEETKLKGIDRHLYDSLSQHFNISICPVVVDIHDYEGTSTRNGNAYIFDYDLVFDIKSDHPLLEKKIAIVTSQKIGKSKKILHRRDFIGYTGNETVPFELSYVSVILALEKKATYIDE